MTAKRSSRAAHGSGSIRKRADGRWEARVTLGRDPLTGKHIRKSMYGQTEKEVRKQLTATTAEVDSGAYTELSKLTVGQWLDVWSDEYLCGLKPNTADNYKASIKNHLKPGLGSIKLAALSAHTVQTLYNRLQRDAGLSPKTVNNIHGILHKAIKQAAELRYIRFNPVDSCILPRIEKPEIKPLEDDAIKAFLEAIRGHKWEHLYTAALFTGMRQGELLGLIWPCVDFKRGRILIDRQLQRDRLSGKYGFTSPKNDKNRRISPAPSVMEALKEQWRRQAEWKLKAGRGWTNENGLVFTDESGGHLTYQAVYSAYKQIAERIGAPSSRFHDLRHTYAVTALQAGDDIKEVQEALGHHTAAFTLDTYAHVTEKVKKESAARMEQYIKRLRRGMP